MPPKASTLSPSTTTRPGSATKTEKFCHPLASSNGDGDEDENADDVIGLDEDDDNERGKPGLRASSAKRKAPFVSTDSRFAAANDAMWAEKFDGGDSDEARYDNQQQSEDEDQPDDSEEGVEDIDNLPPDQQPDILNGETAPKQPAGQKPITLESLKSYTDTVNNTGLVYISRLPPFMTPQKLRSLLQQHGAIGRLYAAPEDAKTAYRRKKYRGNKRINYTEAWVEFEDKRVARRTAEFLNLRNMGGKKRDRFYDDLWNIKYLPRFKWHHLTDQIAYERAVRDQKLKTEMEQVKRETKAYLANVDKAKMIEAMEAKRKRKREEEGGLSGAASEMGGKKELPAVEFSRKFRQREVKEKDTVSANQKAGAKSATKAKVLSKIFG